MPRIVTANRAIVSVRATDSDDWEVVSTPAGFAGITSADFSNNDKLAGFVLFENGVDFEVYDTEDDDTSALLEITNISGTVTISRPATPYDSSNGGDRVSAGSGTHTLIIGMTAGIAKRLLRETNPTWKTFTSGDATPSVVDFRLFKTAGTTTITAFDNMQDGSMFVVQRGASDITIADGATIALTDNKDLLLTEADPIALFVVDNGVAKLISRSPVRDVVPGAQPQTTLTISSGAVTPTRGQHVIAAESGTADNLDTITLTNLRAGDVVEFTVDAGDTITVTNGVGNITTVNGLSLVLTAGQTFRAKVNSAANAVVASAVNQSAPPPATYADLTAIPASGRLDNQIVYVVSRSSDGDGGEGTWRYDASSEATANGGTILAPDDGVGRWFRQYSGALNVMWFGATGFDATPDQSTAIFAAVAAATAAGGGAVLFPDGVYRFKNLRPSSNTSLEAINPGKVTWKFPSSGTIAVTDYILYNATPDSYSDANLSVSGVIVDGENVNSGFNQTRFTPIVNFTRVTGLTLSRVTVKNSEYIGLAVAGCRRVLLDRPEAEACGFKGGSGTFTVTIASPAVFTRANHGFSENLGVKFSTTGALPTGLVAGKTYYVKNITTNTFEVSAVGGYVALGDSVTTSGSQSGTHTLQTVSANGGPAIWMSNSGSDQTKDVEIYAPHVRDCAWTGIHINATGSKVVGGIIENCHEAGVFTPNVPGGDILCDDLTLIGVTIRNISRRDISASGMECGASNTKLVNCHIENVGAGGLSFLDTDTVTVTGCTIKNFNQDQGLGVNHQGSGILVLSLTENNIARNVTIVGNTITDDQESPTGYAAILVTGVAESPENITIHGNAIDSIAWSNSSGEGVLISRAGSGCKVQGNSNTSTRGGASAHALGGRLTLTSSLPVTTADVTAATAIYYHAYVNDVIWTWDGTAFVPSTLLNGQIGLSFTGNSEHENYHQADKNFDVFVFLNENPQSLLLGTGPAWASATSRGTGAGTTELERHKGVWVNKNAMRLRWSSGSGNVGDAAARTATYVGTIRMTANGETEDSLSRRFVWNCYNRVRRSMRAFESTTSWEYSTAAFRQANNSTSNQLSLVRGFDEDIASASIISRVGNSTATIVNVLVQIGLDSTTESATGAIRGAAFPDNVTNATASAEWKGYPGIGYHYISWLERGHGSETQTWFSNGTNGIHGEIYA